MISIIIASRNTSRFEQIEHNIANTIGLAHEIISYDNTHDDIGICEIYNRCAAKSKFEYLVFCHDDILFKTHNWGLELINLLNQEEIGLVGVAGATYKSKYPAPWVSIPTAYYRTNIKKPNDILRLKEPLYEEVVVLDGCFLAMTKRIHKKFPFNQEELKGFHLYDIDISLRISKRFKVLISNKIIVEHFSDGTFDDKWYKQSKRFHESNKNLFPASLDKDYKQNFLNAYAARSLLFRSKSIKMGLAEKTKYLFIVAFLAPYRLFSLRLLTFLLK